MSKTEDDPAGEKNKQGHQHTRVLWQEAHGGRLSMLGSTLPTSGLLGTQRLSCFLSSLSAPSSLGPGGSAEQHIMSIKADPGAFEKVKFKGLFLKCKWGWGRGQAG